MSFFERLKTAASAEWRAYTEHPFTEGLADGSLTEAAFRHYLVQDYLFLIEFARAYALSVYKSPSLADMPDAASGLSAILDVETNLPIKLCGGSRPASGKWDGAWASAEPSLRGAGSESSGNIAASQTTRSTTNIISSRRRRTPCATAYPRHCERSEAIHISIRGQMDCFAPLAMTLNYSGARSVQPQFRDVPRIRAQLTTFHTLDDIRQRGICAARKPDLLTLAHH